MCGAQEESCYYCGEELGKDDYEDQCVQCKELEDGDAFRCEDCGSVFSVDERAGGDREVCTECVDNQRAESELRSDYFASVL